LLAASIGGFGDSNTGTLFRNIKITLKDTYILYKGKDTLHSVNKFGKYEKKIFVNCPLGQSSCVFLGL
jgi:hypothetical protein